MTGLARDEPVDPKRFAAPGSLRRFLGHPQAMAAAVLLVLLGGSAILAPLVTSYAPDAIESSNLFAKPSVEHWFGTDELGRDLFTRVVYGGRVALGIAVAATAVALVIGVAWGFAAAQAHGWVDEIMMRLVDALMAVPVIMFALILVAAFGSSVVNLTVIAGLLLAPGTARIARSTVLAELESDYCRAAVSVGVTRVRLLLSELLPNAAPTLIARASLVAADVIMIEASLSFLGLGITPPAASWGSLLREGYSRLHTSITYVIFPGIVIFLAIWMFNALGDRLQETLDPRGRT